jgi:hypothetical protein
VSSLEATPIDVHRHWLRLLLSGHKKKAEHLFLEACDLYEDALSAAIGLVERIEDALICGIQAFKHFTQSTRSLAELYEELDLIQEAEHLLITHFVFLKKVVEERSTPLHVRDQARQELFQSKELLSSIYERQGKFTLAGQHRERCHGLYFSLLY